MSKRASRGTLLFPVGKAGRKTLPVKQQREMQESFRRSQELREARKKEANRRERMAIKLETEEKCSCGGVILYLSNKHFVRTGPVIFGGPTEGYLSETCHVFCKGCGLQYQASHPRFSEASAEVKRRREPPGEDWVPPEISPEKT